MDTRLGRLLDAIHELERVVADKNQQTKATVSDEIEHGRAVFSPDVRRRHRAMMKRAWRTLIESQLSTIATVERN